MSAIEDQARRLEAAGHHGEAFQLRHADRDALADARAQLAMLQEDAMALARTLEASDGLELIDYAPELPAFEELVHALAGVRVAEPRPLLILREYGSAYELVDGELVQHPLNRDGSVDLGGGGAVDICGVEDAPRGPMYRRLVAAHTALTVLEGAR